MKLRKQLIANAQGRVLEIAAGTGRNIELYKPECCTEVCLTDLSAEMLQVAIQKAEKLNAPPTSITKFEQADSRQLPYPDASFDTAVDTFGLCSFEDPVSSLKELSRVVKPDGKILLLEHGRSKHGWLSSFLDSREKQHVAKYGCYWNRDIESIVNQAGLKIVHKEPHHLGTTMMIVAERNNEMKPSNI